MGTDSRQGKDRDTVRGKNHGAAAEPRSAADAAACRTPSGRVLTQQLRAGARRGPPSAARNPPSFSARAAATTRVITRCSAPRRPEAALRGPPPRPAAGSSPAAEDVEATAAAAAPPARFPILVGRGPPSSRSGATLLREATAAAREPWSGLWPR